MSEPDLQREIEFLKRTLGMVASHSVATDCWIENMQAVSDLANGVGFQVEFSEGREGKVNVHMTRREKSRRPTHSHKA